MGERDADELKDGYESYVEHPRFGRGPRITGLNPQPSDEGVRLHWRVRTVEEFTALFAEVRECFPGFDIDEFARSRRHTRPIPGTAIAADLYRQTPATYPVTHYFDIARACCDCGRPFIFFAEEQKYWYEELGFTLDADCIRCVECRKDAQRLARHRENYEQLFHVSHRDVEQNLDMAEACLVLIEAGIFTRRKTETVRMLLNGVPDDAEARNGPRFAELRRKLIAVESQSK